MVAIIGKVTKCGKVKQYTNKKTGEQTPKFFLELDTKEHGLVKVMVTTSLDKASQNYRERPFAGDIVRVESWGINNKGWMNITPVGSYKILFHDGKKEWIKNKKEEEQGITKLNNRVKEKQNEIESENTKKYINSLGKLLHFENDISSFQASLIVSTLEDIYKNGQIGPLVNIDKKEDNRHYNAWALVKAASLGLLHVSNIKEYDLTEKTKEKMKQIIKVKRNHEKREFSVQGYFIGYANAIESQSLDEKDILENLFKLRDSNKNNWYHTEFKQRLKNFKDNYKLTDTDIDRILSNFNKNIEAGIRAGIKDKQGVKHECS
ncbi:MAG: hypothetical protein ACOC56_05155 [Atribacterota bacterium]